MASHCTPAQNRALTRHNLQALFAHLAILIRRLYPQLSSAIFSDDSGSQRELVEAKQRVRDAGKVLWWAALGGGLMVLGRRVGGLELEGMGTMVEEEVLVEVVWAAAELLEELEVLIEIVREGRRWS
jgi:hypothetical protein